MVLNHKLIGIALACVFSMPCVLAQTPPLQNSPGADAPADKPAELGGKTTIDLITYDGSPSLPLKSPGIVVHSEIVEAEGRRLVRGSDYTLDAEAGILYLHRPLRPGTSIRVTYRFDPSKSRVTRGPLLTKANSLSFNLAQGTSLSFGLGLAERTSSGAVFSANVYGLHNNFAPLKGLGLTGVTIVSERRLMRAQSLYEPIASDNESDGGRSQAIVQNLNGQLLGGKVEGSWQDVRTGFTAFENLRSAGFDDAALQRLERERGLKRVGLNITDVGTKQVKLSHGFRSVDDGKGRIDWRSFGFAAAGLDFAWTRQFVDPQFQRFGDLSEGDREMLARERGLDRQTLGAGFKQGALALRYDALKVEDEAGAGVYRRQINLGTGRLKASLTDQSVDRAFNRFNGLREGDAGQLAREQGLRRQAVGLEYDQAKFSRQVLRTDGGDFKAHDLNLASKGIRLSHSVRDADRGFGLFWNLPEPEIQGHLRAIAQMYEEGEPQLRGEDRNAMLGGLGLDRQVTRLGFDLGRQGGITLSRLQLGGEQDGGKVETVAWNRGGTRLLWRQQQLGDRFSELQRLMPFEQARLGPIVGLDRQDFAFASAMGKDRGFSFENMRADAPQGEAWRMIFALQDPRFSMRYARRNVEHGFEGVGQMADPERELLAQLRGFAQSELQANANPMRGLKLSLNWSNAASAVLQQERVFRETNASYQFDARTTVNYRQLRLKNDDPSRLLLGQAIDRWSIDRDLGRWGKLSLTREARVFDGLQGEAPDSTTEALSYQVPVSKATAVRTDQVRTQFDNGESETVSQNTISTALTSRTGVSLTETRVERSDQPDEAKRDYGFWVDFGRGIRLNYGYARQLKDETNGTMQSKVELSPGEVQGLKVEGASYNVQRWDNQRQRSQGAVRIETAKPLQMGWMRDVTFVLGTNTTRDRDRWEQENRLLGIGAKIGGSALNLNYRSVIDPQGDRGIDRAFGFTTDPAKNRSFSGSMAYRVRTLPGDRSFITRNTSLTYRPARGWELSHQLVANPEVADGNVLMGSTIQATSASKWGLQFTGNKRMQLGFTWEELMNTPNRTLSRVGGLNFRLFADDQGTSPLELFYGIEENENQGLRRHLHRYHLRFDQRPGPNQQFSFFLGNVSWMQGRRQEEQTQNWTLRTEFQLRF